MGNYKYQYGNLNAKDQSMYHILHILPISVCRIFQEFVETDPEVTIPRTCAFVSLLLFFHNQSKATNTLAAHKSPLHLGVELVLVVP